MIITLTFTKKELLDLITNRTIYLANPVGEKEKQGANRIGELIPLMEDDYSFFNSALFSASKKVYSKLAYNVTDIDIPYVISGDDDTDYPDPIVIYRFNLYTGANEKVIIPMVQQAVVESLIYFIISEWLTTKNYFDQAAIFNKKFEESLPDIKSALMYGQRASKTYRTL